MSTSTTLITFLFRAPPKVFSVELLGSWDNFSKPYKLSRDRKTGDDHWRGCHVFENITCDGNTSERSEGRDGALLMGGTYWYYYRLNTETEYHDPAEPYTSSCPLLPGQPVNILDIPVQPERPMSSNSNDSSESSDLDTLVFTLDPRDKYLPPGVRRALTTSAIQQRKMGIPRVPTMPMNGWQDAQDSEDPPHTGNSTRAGPTLKPQRSLVSMFEKLRRTKSAGPSARASTSWHRRLLSRAGSRAGSSKRASPTEAVPAVPKIPDYISSKFQGTGATTTPPVARRRAPRAMTDPEALLTTATENWKLSSDSSTRKISLIPKPTLPQDGDTQCEIPSTSLLGEFGAPRKPRRLAADLQVPAQFGETISVTEEYHRSPPETAPSFRPVISRSPIHEAAAGPYDPSSEGPIECETFLCESDSREEPQTTHLSAYGYTESSLSLYATEDNFSPCLAPASNQDSMSPVQLSQPETPIMSDFEDDAASWTGGSDSLHFNAMNIRPPSRDPPPPPPQQPSFSNPFRTHPPLSGFQGYCLPQDEHGSALTLKKPPNSSFGHSNRALNRPGSSKDAVHSWNDGSEHRMTALEGLVGDLGYLGDLIN